MINKLRFEEEKIIKDIRNLLEEEDFCKPVRENNFWSNNYIEYKINGDKNTILSADECLDKIRPYLRDINNLKQSDTGKTQLTKTINFISSKDDKDEERVMHSKSNNIEIMISEEAIKLQKKIWIH